MEKKKQKKEPKKIEKPVKRVTNAKDLKGAMQKLPDNKRSAWFKVVGGFGTVHNGSGVMLEKGAFEFLRIADVKDAVELFERVNKDKPTETEGK